MSEAVTPGIIRKLWPGEQHVLRDHLLRLDPESRRSRFCSTVSEEFIEHYAGRVFRSGSMIHGCFVDGELRAAAELYPDSKILADGAEIAFSVEEEFQNLGLGTLLLERSILVARNRGIRHLHLTCLPHNRRMQQVVRKFKAELTFEYDEVMAELTAPYATALSLAEEASADAMGMAGAVLQAQRRATGAILDLFLSPAPARAA